MSGARRGPEPDCLWPHVVFCSLVWQCDGVPYSTSFLAVTFVGTKLSPPLGPPCSCSRQNQQQYSIISTSTPSNGAA